MFVACHAILKTTSFCRSKPQVKNENNFVFCAIISITYLFFYLYFFSSLERPANCLLALVPNNKKKNKNTFTSTLVVGVWLLLFFSSFVCDRRKEKRSSTRRNSEKRIHTESESIAIAIHELHSTTYIFHVFFRCFVFFASFSCAACNIYRWLHFRLCIPFFHVTRCGKKKMFADWARMIQWLVLPNHWYISKFADKCDRIWTK